MGGAGGGGAGGGADGDGGGGDAPGGTVGAVPGAASGPGISRPSMVPRWRTSSDIPTILPAGGAAQASHGPPVLRCG